MNMIWKYKIDLVNEKVFSEIENERKINIPNELKTFIIENNAATPSKYKFIIKGTEKVFGAVLSFNHGEKNTDSIFTALDIIEDKNILPFAIDPFGNYICYNISEKQIVFWDHETNITSSTEKNMQEFLTSLY